LIKTINCLSQSTCIPPLGWIDSLYGTITSLYDIITALWWKSADMVTMALLRTGEGLHWIFWMCWTCPSLLSIHCQFDCLIAGVLPYHIHSVVYVARCPMSGKKIEILFSPLHNRQIKTFYCWQSSDQAPLNPLCPREPECGRFALIFLENFILWIIVCHSVLSQSGRWYNSFLQTQIEKEYSKMNPGSRVLFLASQYVSKQVRVVPSINRPTRVNPSVFCSLKKEPCLEVLQIPWYTVVATV
jgi:hypothetical protein